MLHVLSDFIGLFVSALADAAPVSAINLDAGVTAPIASSSVGSSDLNIYTGIAAIAIIAAATLLFRERNARLRSKGE